MEFIALYVVCFLWLANVCSTEEENAFSVWWRHDWDIRKITNNWPFIPALKTRRGGTVNLALCTSERSAEERLTRKKQSRSSEGSSRRQAGSRLPSYWQRHKWGYASTLYCCSSQHRNEVQSEWESINFLYYPDKRWAAFLCPCSVALKEEVFSPSSSWETCAPPPPPLLKNPHVTHACI